MDVECYLFFFPRILYETCVNRLLFFWETFCETWRVVAKLPDRYPQGILDSNVCPTFIHSESLKKRWKNTSVLKASSI